MLFTIIEVGGVGSCYAALLKKSGNEVSVLTRGANLDKIRKDGIRIISDSGDSIVRVDLATDRISDMGKADVIVVAVKAWQVEDIADQLVPIVGDKTIIIPIQNGVEAYPTLKSRFPDNAFGGLTRIIAMLEAPGIVRHLGKETYLSFGKDDGKVTENMKSARDAFVNAGIKCEISSNIQKEIWEKFLMMTPLSGVGSVTRAPLGVLRSLEGTRTMLENAMNEVINLARAMNVDLDEDSKIKGWKFIDSAPFETTSSIHRDIVAGRPSEIAFLAGAVARLGKVHNVRVPIHEFIYDSLLPGEMRARGKLTF